MDCQDGSDEHNCYLKQNCGMVTPRPPGIIYFNGFGSFVVRYLPIRTKQSSTLLVCPETHFLCPGNLTYCMPVFVRCNGVYDCPGREDEDGCDRYQCPGFYRCRASSTCVHAWHLCDGVYQCPQHDDELLCGATCPQNCTCYGLAFYCHGRFPTDHYGELRFLHAAESGLSPANLKLNFMLVYLNLAKCSLEDFNQVEFPNLRFLYLSDNKLTSLNATQMQSMNNLQKLSISGNPLKFLLGTTHNSSKQFLLLRNLDLSNVVLPVLNAKTLHIFPKLAFLNLTGCGITHVTEEGFRSFSFLKYLDMRRCPMTEFPSSIFQGLKGLKEVWGDNYKLCCRATLPKGFDLTNCHAPSDEISSCEDLLRSDLYRIALSLFTVLALIGNLGSLVYRALINRESTNLGFGVFVTHLCASDLLMGVYLAVIGIADWMYRGNYLWKDNDWKQSGLCKVAGFLSLLSTEVSAFIIFLITVDRFLVLRFPFSSVHFQKNSAHLACITVWLAGVMLAGIPLLPATAHWNFYSQNGICIPLPITRNDFAGHHYSFGVMIVVNFVLFILIAAGQIFIYWSIYTNSMAAGGCNKRSNDVTIARRLITIAVSDFLCWFPIGLLGLLASNDVPIPGEVSVAMAILILPINSAINPFLYTINMLMERRRKSREIRMQKMIMSAKMQSEARADRRTGGYNRSEALHLISKWISHNLLSYNNLKQIVLEADGGVNVSLETK